VRIFVVVKRACHNPKHTISLQGSLPSRSQCLRSCSQEGRLRGRLTRPRRRHRGARCAAPQLRGPSTRSRRRSPWNWGGPLGKRARPCCYPRGSRSRPCTREGSPPGPRSRILLGKEYSQQILPDSKTTVCILELSCHQDRIYLQGKLLLLYSLLLCRRNLEGTLSDLSTFCRRSVLQHILFV